MKLSESNDLVKESFLLKFDNSDTAAIVLTSLYKLFNSKGYRLDLKIVPDNVSLDDKPMMLLMREEDCSIDCHSKDNIVYLNVLTNRSGKTGVIGLDEFIDNYF